MASAPQRTASVSARSHKRSRGFSLVELSIVLVLISLLVGGIMAGLNVKHAAELKSVNDEVAAIRNTVKTFNDRYGGLPGDLYNATKYWGAADADFATCTTTPSTDKKTCNGDGNGMISTPGDGTTYYEAHRFWQHLTNAQLLNGRYTGHRAGVDENATCLSDAHCGSSKLKNGAYYLATIRFTEDYFQPTGLSGLLTFPGDKGHAMVLFRNSNKAATGSYVGMPVLSAEDAFSLDKKFDDTRPASGNLQSFKPDTGTSYLSNSCATTNDEATARYNLSSSEAQCALIFTNMF